MSTQDNILPTHPVTGETALGLTRRGPIWPVAGAAPEEDPAGQDPGTETGEDDTGEAGNSAQGDDGGTGDDGDQSGQSALGDAGKKALQDMKGKWKSEREKRKQLEEQLEQAQTRQSTSTSGTGTGETDTEEVRRQADKEATAKANRRIIKAEVKAAASGKLADPADAVRFLDLEQFEVDESGDIDSDEVAEAITELVTNKPYLAAQGGKRFQGTADSGARKGNTGPKQLTRDDLKRMSPEEITAAKKEGRLNDLLGRAN
ncbi:hypothetical protein SAMN04487819_11673 [Actinopolyspora alba]|uniref:Scaffolding protein n=1 Tax=Actinopolyspora alba TaxID=673379 RepID=A0A1I2BFP1_9ACTN|nr:hypothetical protein [Actinopolyspora alba]SFE54777.1 hypothetical protein SAMN04487819_11673 [Actinopolyspora alba]